MTDFPDNPFFYLRRPNGKGCKIFYDATSLDYQNLCQKISDIGQKQFKISKENQVIFLRGQPLNSENLAQMILEMSISGKAENNIVHLIDKYKVIQQKISFLLVQVDLDKKDRLTYSADEKVRKLIVDILEGDQEYIEQFFVIYAGMVLNPESTFKQQYVENLSKLYFMDSNLHLKDEKLLKQRLSTYSVASSKQLKQSVFSFAGSIRKPRPLGQIQRPKSIQSKKQIQEIRRSHNNQLSSLNIQRKCEHQSTQISGQKTCNLYRDQLIQELTDSNIDETNINVYLSSEKTCKKKASLQVNEKADSLSAIYSSIKQPQKGNQSMVSNQLDGRANIIINSLKLNQSEEERVKKEAETNIWETDIGQKQYKQPNKQITGQQIKEILDAKRKVLKAKTDLSKLPIQLKNQISMNISSNLRVTTNSIQVCESQIVSFYQSGLEQQIDQSSIEQEGLLEKEHFQYSYEPFTIKQDPEDQPINFSSVTSSKRNRTGEQINSQLPFDKISQQNSQDENQSIKQKDVSSDGSVGKKLYEDTQRDQRQNSNNRKQKSQIAKTSNNKQASFWKKSEKKLIKRQSSKLKDEQDSAQLDQLQQKGNNFIATNIQGASSLNVVGNSDFDSYLQQVLKNKTYMSVAANQNKTNKQTEKLKSKKIINLQAIIQSKNQNVENEIQHQFSHMDQHKSNNLQLQGQNIVGYSEKQYQKEHQLKNSKTSSRDQLKIQIKQVCRQQFVTQNLISQQKSHLNLFTERYSQKMIQSWNKSINIMQGTSIMIEESSDQEEVKQQNRQFIGIHKSNELTQQDSIIIWKGEAGLDQIQQQEDRSSSDEQENNDKNILNPIVMQTIQTQGSCRLFITLQYQERLINSWNKSINIMQGQSLMLEDSSFQENNNQIVKGQRNIEIRREDSIIIWKGDGNLSIQGNGSSSDQWDQQQDLMCKIPEIKVNYASNIDFSVSSSIKQPQKSKQSESQQSQQSDQSLIIWRAKKQSIEICTQI